MIEFDPLFVAWMPGDFEYIGMGGLPSWPGGFYTAMTVVIGYGTYHFLRAVVLQTREASSLAIAVVVAFACGWGFVLAGDASASRLEKYTATGEPARLRGRPININTASRDMLEAVPGIGPATATRILDHRPFASVQDVARLPGMKRSNWEAMKPWINVGSVVPKPLPSSAPWPPTVLIKNETDRTLRVLFMENSDHKLIVSRTIGPRTRVEQPHLEQKSAYIAVMDGNTEILSGTYFRDLLGLTILELQGRPQMLEVTH